MSEHIAIPKQRYAPKRRSCGRDGPLLLMGATTQKATRFPEAHLDRAKLPCKGKQKRTGMAGTVRQARLPTPASDLSTHPCTVIAGASEEDRTRVTITLQDSIHHGGVPPRPRTQRLWTAARGNYGAATPFRG